MIKHISKSGEEFLDDIDKKRKGLVRNLMTSIKKFNAVTGGIPWNRIVTLAARSGGGKSVLLSQFLRDFCDLNGGDIECLSFQLELLGSEEVSRMVSSRIGMSTDELYSNYSKLDDEQYHAVQEKVKEISEYPMFHVEGNPTTDQVFDIVLKFTKERNLRANNKSLVVTLDHVLLLGDDGAEKPIIDKISKIAIRLKRYFKAWGINIIIILLSQMNREVDKPDRIINPKLHKPMRSDIHGSSSLFNASDLLMVLHRPNTLDGIDNIGHYTTNRWPLKTLGGNDLLYLHILKNRFGKTSTMILQEDFESSRIIDYDINNQT